jgi:hypothetical protein
LKLINHAVNYFAVFGKKNIEFYGSYAEYLGTQPLEGVKWSKDLTGEDFKKLPEVFSCTLPADLDNVYPSIINKRVMKRAMQSPELMVQLAERLIDDIKTEAARDIKKKMISIIGASENYKNSAWFEWTADECRIDTLDKAIAVVDWIYATSGEMLEESTNYNKGYQKPGSREWNEVLVNSESRKDLIVFIDTSFYNPLRTRFLAGIPDGNNWVNLKADFGQVIEMKLPNQAKVIIRDKNSVAYTIIAEDGIEEELIKASGSTKLYFHPTIISGNIPFANAASALVAKGE